MNQHHNSFHPYGDVTPALMSHTYPSIMSFQPHEQSIVHMAYFDVHSFANLWYLSLSDLYILAISGTNGSSGFGSVSSEQIDSNTEKDKHKKILRS